MYRGNIVIRDKSIRYVTDSLAVNNVIKNNFELSKIRNAEAFISIYYSKEEKAIIDILRKRITIYYSNPREINKGYSYINITKWIIRMMCLLFEPENIFCIHSAACVFKNRGIMIIGETGLSGKTTICLGLVRKGAKYVDDEYVFLYNSKNNFKFFGPKLKPYVRIGTIIGFPELQIPSVKEMVRNHVNMNYKTLWEDDDGESIDIFKIYKIKPIKEDNLNVILFTKLSPEIRQITFEKLSKNEAFKLLLPETLKHIYKLIDQKEFSSKSISNVEDMIEKNLDLSTNKRHKFLENIVKDVPCIKVSGGSNMIYLVESVQKFIESLNL